MLSYEGSKPTSRLTRSGQVNALDIATPVHDLRMKRLVGRARARGFINLPLTRSQFFISVQEKMGALVFLFT